VTVPEPTEDIGPNEPAPSDEPDPPAKGRFHLLKQILQNALTLGSALLLFYFVPIGNEDHPIWRWGCS